MASTTRYARSGDVSIAYQVVGSGPVDLVFAPGFVSHMELAWEDPLIIQAKSSRAPTAGSVARRLTAGSTAFNLTLAKRVPTRLVVPPLLKWRTFHEATENAFANRPAPDPTARQLLRDSCYLSRWSSLGRWV